MANLQLVIIPSLISLILVLAAILFFRWLKIQVKKRNKQLQGIKMAGIFGYSLMILAGFSLFISLFFVITG